MKKDRCSRIAELLLIENEVKKLETASEVFNVSETILEWEDYYKSKGINFTPIEKIMYAILTRVCDNFYESYDKSIEIGFRAQPEIGKYTVDFLVTASFSDTMVVIECDGHDFHEKTKEQAKHDKERDRWLTSQGYKILRYTGSEIYNDFDKIEKELSKLLDVPYGISLFEEKKQ
jgi:very-short-patch-repair endonuclease